MKFSVYRIPVLYLVLALSLVSCSGGGGSSARKPPSKCVSAPDETATQKIAWTYEECGPLSNGQYMRFFMSQVGHVPSPNSDTGFATEALGSRPVNKGHMTFKYSSLDWSEFPWPTDDVLLVSFHAQNQAKNRTMNWHILAVRWAVDGRVETRLVSQREEGTGCIPAEVRKCEKQEQDFDMPKYERSSVYRFDVTWDTTVPSMDLAKGGGANVIDGLVRVKIYDATNPSKEVLVQTYSVPTSGPYNMLDTVAVGGRASQTVQKAGVAATLSEFRLTIFSE